MAWDILLILTSVAGNLCNKCPSGYLNKTAVKVILSMRSLVSIEQQSPRRPCDIPLKSSKSKYQVVYEQKFKDLLKQHMSSKYRKKSVGLGIRGHERPGFYSHWG